MIPIIYIIQFMFPLVVMLIIFIIRFIYDFKQGYI